MACSHIPLVDLHRHLEGSVRVETILDVARRFGVNLPTWDPDDLRAQAQIIDSADHPIDLLEVLPKFAIAQHLMVSYEACQALTLAVLEDAAREGIDYIELRFSPLFMAEAHGLDPMGVASAVCEAWQEARNRLPIRSQLIGIMSRTYGPEACRLELEAAIAHRERGIVALDLAGDEGHFPAHLFVDHYRRARAAGLHLTAHAGEFAGVDSVRQAVLELGVERIGHGVHAIDDPAVLDLLADRQVAIECCLTSNVQVAVVPGYREHPLPLFLARGLLATLNSDDPAISGIDLSHEYRVAQEELGLNEAQLYQLRRNGVQAAFLTPEERAALLGEK